MPDCPRSTLIQGAVLGDGSQRDVLVTDGLVAALGDHAGAVSDRLERIDLRGYILLPAPVEAHAHLDKALLSDRLTFPSFDLGGAVAAVRRSYPTMTTEDLQERASRAAHDALVYGSTAIRTHIDSNPLIGTRAVRAVVALRESLRDLLDIQVVALAGFPIAGPAGAPNRRALQDALSAGADLVGGVPVRDPDPEAAVGELLTIARAAGCGVDLHIDETTDPDALSLISLARLVSSTSFDHPVTASHCVSLGVQPAGAAAQIARAVADAGISVVTLPQSNLYLQGRDVTTQLPRGLTAIAELRAAGVTVAGGGDNWRDPFNPMGRPDPLHTAALLVIAGHLTPEQAYAAVSDAARAALGLPAVQVAAGYPADLLAVRGSSLAEILATGSADRVVLRAGRPVVRTRVQVEWRPR